MCIGEKRTLTIGPSYGYGDRNIGPIPAGSTLSMTFPFPPTLVRFSMSPNRTNIA